MTDTDQRTVIEVLTTDHREVEGLFTRIESTLDPSNARTAADEVITELVKHAVAEEMFLYPAVRKLPGGEELAEHEWNEHAEAEKTMKELDGMDPSDERFRPMLLQLMAEIRHHVQGEEGELFPLLAQHADVAELRRLGAEVEAAKKTAPTHPHPMAPDKPPLNRMMNPGAGLVDRLRDTLTGRNKQS